MKKISFILITTFIFTTLILPINAVYQVVPVNGKEGVSSNNFFINIRKMESLNQTLGLSQTINEENAADANEKNKVDVHMMKNTEYGVVAMFAASQYGKVKAGMVEDLNSASSATTSNPYGVYQMANRYQGEYLAAIYKDVNTNSGYYTHLSKLKAASLNDDTKKYVDAYEKYTGGTIKSKAGDALIETNNWYSSKYDYPIEENSPTLIRGNVAVFSANHYSGSYRSRGYGEERYYYYSNRHNLGASSRAVIVNGDNI